VQVGAGTLYVSRGYAFAFERDPPRWVVGVEGGDPGTRPCDAVTGSLPGGQCRFRRTPTEIGGAVDGAASGRPRHGVVAREQPEVGRVDEALRGLARSPGSTTEAAREVSRSHGE
jgi:hypothetical protein